jgi:lysophospholipase L1-like esterase
VETTIMRTLHRRLPLLFALAAVLALAAPAAAEFPLKDGDIWVMAGDSITAQHLHSNYFEAFCFARYPNLKFAFRNSGVGGHTIPSTLARFEYDIAVWKPTVVSVELGMNDSGGTPTDKFVVNMGTMVERIRGIKARPVILSASPVNDGTTTAKLAGRNIRLNEYADALKPFAAKEQVPYADQFHALVDVWGKNKTSENAVNLTGDPVHPGAPGQLMMAAALLKALDADPFVSSVTLDGTGKVVEAKGCKVTDAKLEAGKLVFDRLDERLPFPIADNARTVLALDPTILAMSQYTLKVTGLKGSSHTLTINGIPAGTLTSQNLATGVNLTALPALPQAKEVNPITGQGRAILAAVAAKEGIVGKFRALSRAAHAADAKPELKEQLAAELKKVEEADAKIREAAQPQKLHFELTPAQ